MAEPMPKSTSAAMPMIAHLGNLICDRSIAWISPFVVTLLLNVFRFCTSAIAFGSDCWCAFVCDSLALSPLCRWKRSRFCCLLCASSPACLYCAGGLWRKCEWNSQRSWTSITFWRDIVNVHFFWSNAPTFFFRKRLNFIFDNQVHSIWRTPNCFAKVRHSISARSQQSTVISSIRRCILK